MEKVLFFVGVLMAPDRSVGEVSNILSQALGAGGLVSDTYPFDYTDYYQNEMGPHLKRFFWSLKHLGAPIDLAGLKKHTIQLEKEFFSQKGKRFVNLDPGYLDPVKIVLASTKAGGHKIALEDGFYADMVMDYFKGSFRSFDWTFPDFKAGLYDDYFKRLRSFCMSP